MWELQMHQGDISYHEDLRKNSRQKTEGGDKHLEKSSSVSRRAEGQLMPYLQAGVGKNSGRRRRNYTWYLSTLRRHMTGYHGRKF